MQLTILDTVNDPGTSGKTGDDRVGFDASAGTAWVLDGATDVTDLRPFNRAESGAAWVAQALSDRLIIAPHDGETVEAYFEHVLSDVRQRAVKETRLPLDSLPGEALPIASGMWMRLEGDTATFAWLGDCMGFHQRGAVVTVIGSPDKADDETDVARTLLAGTPEAKMAHLQAARRQSNEQATGFGLDPRAAANLQTQVMTLQAGDRICLMSDGLYRLVSPYATHTPDTFMALVAEDGLGAAITTLRAFESTPDRDMPRLKARDDSSGVYVEIKA
ncbi:protein phosphatase 2C domain-containing protein [Hyphomonas chukchiensis]|uniref:PPM-type phosphatase domain-containing protein n=1 Tax=Hyphomonas chukchiensis TaxID=1280947 RepID=A0A062UM23_9PROT|nr:protein phosphatase 2C domain-containing protein [Hyphomonas chukchiensis]KCZ57619.1 hypothetical protein HY30_05430 [Hyphomonas chukchiensis]